MTKEDLINFRKILENKKVIENNNSTIKQLKQKREMYMKYIKKNNNLIRHNQEIIDMISKRELIVEKHNRLKNSDILQVSSYIFLISLFINNAFNDTSFLSYVLCFLSSVSLIAFETLETIDKNLILECEDIDFDDFSLELKKKSELLIKNMSFSVSNDEICIDIQKCEQKINELECHNMLLGQESKEYLSTINISYSNKKGKVYRRM